MSSLLGLVASLLATARLTAVSAERLPVLLALVSALGRLSPLLALLLALLAALALSLLAELPLALGVLALAASLAWLLPALLRAHARLLAAGPLARWLVPALLFPAALLPLELAGFRGPPFLRGTLTTASLSALVGRLSALVALPVSVSITSGHEYWGVGYCRGNDKPGRVAHWMSRPRKEDGSACS